MTTEDLKALVCCACVAVCGAVCFYGGYMMRDSLEDREVVTPAPEKRQGDDSLILERKPDPSPGPPPHDLPRGAIEERRVTVTVRPDANRKYDTTKGNDSVTPERKCPPVQVNLSLVRDSEGGRRVVASSPDGRVLGGLDVPILGTNLPNLRTWAAGVSYDPFNESPGFWAERDIGRLRIGADLYQDRAGPASGMAVRVRVGWTF